MGGGGGTERQRDTAVDNYIYFVLQIILFLFSLLIILYLLIIDVFYNLKKMLIYI